MNVNTTLFFPIYFITSGHIIAKTIKTVAHLILDARCSI